jgi:two-component system phosphate regulon sensor histidine kinase PhoR
MDNAIKYSTESVNIEIRCEQKEEATIICIKDDGYGISKKEQEKIFAKFERGKAVQRNEARGFGLGLSYVKKVMEAHGGTIGLFSEEGVGSEFVLFVPASAEEAVPH